MNISTISIHQTFGALDIQMTPSQMDISSPQSRVNVHYEPAEVSIQTEAAEIKTDMQPVWDTIGLKSVEQWAKDLKAAYQKKYMENLSREVSEGDRLGNIASGEKNVFAHLAMERFFQRNQVETNVGLMPKEKPIFDVQTHPPQIEITPQSPTVQPNDIRPQINYQPSKEHIDWLVEPQIDIQV